MMAFRKLGWSLASLIVFTGHSLPAKKLAAVRSRFPLMGGSSRRLMRQLRYGFCSPTTITLATHGRAFFISFSMRTGGMFSPPAVIMSSLARPVIKRYPSLLIFPRSPDAKNPSLSIVLLVSSACFRYPIIMFLPRMQISPSSSVLFYFLIKVSHPGIGTPTSKKSSGVFGLNARADVPLWGPVVSVIPQTFSSRKFIESRYLRTTGSRGAAPKPKYTA